MLLLWFTWRMFSVGTVVRRTTPTPHRGCGASKLLSAPLFPEVLPLDGTRGRRWPILTTYEERAPQSRLKRGLLQHQRGNVP